MDNLEERYPIGLAALGLSYMRIMLAVRKRVMGYWWVTKQGWPEYHTS
jgi:hypothetical protein